MGQVGHYLDYSLGVRYSLQSKSKAEGISAIRSGSADLGAEAR